ncbi:hypothetical protein H9P43_007432 [Blastocladiella emersonii ATCC 22665]|nr:hypothetical protein H9P43_007432 [Blastocladiella emersonii ATCC 22665]
MASPAAAATTAAPALASIAGPRLSPPTSPPPPAATLSSAKPKTATGTSHLAAGAMSGLATCIILQPFDVVKTRLQQAAVDCDRSLAETAAGRRGGVLPARLAGFRSLGITGQIQAVVRQVVDERGVQGLWRGTSPTILRNVPGSAFYFFFLHHLRHALHGSGAVSRDTANMVSGATARGVAGLIFMPVSVIKVRYESSAYAYTSVLGAARDIVAREGVRGLFAGFGATAARDVPYAGIYVTLYEQLKPIGLRVAGPESTSIATMGSGVVAGLLATVLTQPFDLVKTRVQINPAEYPNSWVAARKVFTGEGIRGFFAGMSPRLVRKPLHAAITWTVYEEVSVLLRRSGYLS